MISAKRFPGNPILSPDTTHPWEAQASFNGCPVVARDGCHLLYRAQSDAVVVGKHTLELSTIGHAISFDRVTFRARRQLIVPEEKWEQYGCEDPRITAVGDDYFIFYTALAAWPPEPAEIRVAVAVTGDFRTIKEKHLVTPFNAKAMTLFPERIGGKLMAILTVNPDIPPSTIAIASFTDPSELWDHGYWKKWHKEFPDYAVPLLRSNHDHVEIGAPPLKTAKGWLLIYSYIRSYLTSHKFFGIEAALLDLTDPQKILAHTQEPLLYPERDYELRGKIPNVVFPSGALVYNDTLGIYYGAADTRVCLATCPLADLFGALS